MSNIMETKSGGQASSQRSFAPKENRGKYKICLVIFECVQTNDILK